MGIINLNFISFINAKLKSNYIGEYFKSILHTLMYYVQLFCAVNMQELHYMRSIPKQDRFIPRLRIFLALFLFFSLSAQAAEISGTVFNDLDGDGMKDDGEPGLSGWTISLSNSDTEETKYAFTNDNGAYSFTGLSQGSYLLREIFQDGWTCTMPPFGEPYDIYLYEGTNSAGNNFGNHQTSGSLSISGTKFNDLDGDGTKDTGEPGLSGWTIKLENLDTLTTTNAITDDNGAYSFTGLTAGGYSLFEVQQDGWTRTKPSADSYQVTLTTTSLAGMDFGNHRTSGSLSISGTKFNDLDGDGTKDTGEPGLSGWTIKLENLDTLTTTNAITDDNGAYSFTGLTAGGYSLFEVQQDGWTRTKPSADSYPVTLTTTSLAGMDFGNHQSSIGPTISGTVFYDMNGDGQKGSTEPGLSGCTVNLAGAAARTTISGSDGSYSFSSLSAGQYTITQVPQSGWLQSSPAGSYSVNLGSTSVDNQDFGNRGSYSLSGSVFYDPDGDGINNGAMGVPGWTIHLTLTGVSTSGLSALAAEENTAASYSLEGEISTTSDSQGHYCFSGLVPGSYTISQDPPNVGWVQTYPKSIVYQINLQGNMENIDFGNLQGNSALVVTKKASSSTAHRSEFEFTRNDSSRHDF